RDEILFSGASYRSVALSRFPGILRDSLTPLRREPLPMKRLLDPPALRALARGCAVLGAGGGGDTYLALLQALQATADHHPVPLVDLDELPDNALVMPCGGIGAPTVSIEKIENGDEGERLRDHLEAVTGRRVAALMAGEIGGGNGLVPVAWAARMGLPVAD